MTDAPARVDDIHICVDPFVPADRVAAVEAAALAERPDNLLIVPVGADAETARPRMGLRTQTMWKPGTTLAVRFLDGDPSVQARVEEAAHGWEQHANVRFTFGEDPAAQIRVTFAGKGSWSQLGTVARQVPRHEATMNFGWLTPTTDATEYARVVLHEFGHALGCIHEHQSPDITIPWDKDAVYAHYAALGWSRTRVETNLFEAYSPDGIAFSRFDRDSIMLYPVPEQLTVGGWSVGWNRTLSDGDKAFIRGQYPFEPKLEPELTVGAAPLDADIGADLEVDRYRFEVTAAGRYVFRTLGPTPLVVSLHGPDDETKLVTVEQGTGAAASAPIDQELAPGRYLVQVRHFRPQGTGRYQIAVDRFA